MNQSIVRSLLSIACAAATTIALSAQSAIVIREQEPAPAREQVRVRLAEVISLLEDEDLSPAQRADAKAKLHEILAQLDKERDAGGRARHRVVEVQRPDGNLAERIDPVEIPTVEGREAPVAVLQAEPAEPPVPPDPVRKPRVRALRLLGGRGVDVAPDAAPLDGHKAHLESLLGKVAADEARLEALESLQRKNVELDNAASEMRLRGRLFARAKQEAEHAARVADEARAEARDAEQDAEAMPSLRARFGKVPQEVPKERARKRVRVVEEEHADSDDLRAMVEEMREEMREIRALIRDLRTHAQDDHAGPFGGADAAPAHGGGGMSSSSFDAFAPARAFGSGGGFSASIGTAPSTSFGLSASGGACSSAGVAPLPGQRGGSGGAALAPAATSAGQGGCCSSSSAPSATAPKSVN